MIAYAPVDPHGNIHVRWISDDYLSAMENIDNDYDNRPCSWAEAEAAGWRIRCVRIELDKETDGG